MFKRFVNRITFYLLIGASFKLSAQQSGTPFQNLINVNTKSPEAASLGKFGNIPVSYNTGTAAVTIPVYQISVGGLNVPVSLDYHTGGIRVDETSSSVGLGWSLNAAGAVSRNMVGKADETTGFINVPDAQTVLASPGQYYQYIYGLRDGANDPEPDIFQYNGAGISGKFIFKKNGGIIQIPVTNNKITFNTGSSFTIVDPNGNTYIFSEKRQNSSSDANAEAYVSTWCLTQMIAANTVDVINFIYESNVYTSYEKNTNFTQNFGVTLGKSDVSATGESVNVTPDIGPHQSFLTINHEEFYLKEINWKNGKVLFNNAADRTDISGSGLRLGSIDVYSKLGSQYTLIKNVKLFQSYFFSNLSGGAVTEKNYRLKLDSVGYQNLVNNTTEQMYRMEYNSTPIAPRESFAQDRWGFNNGHYENSDLMPRQTANFNGLVYTFGGANRETDASQCLAATISSIKYPTQGKTVFEFEPHQYHTNLAVTESKSLSQTLCCATSSHTQTSFTPNSYAGSFSYQVFISKFNYPDVTNRPRVKITDQTTGQVVVQVSTIPTTATDIDYTTGNVAMSLTQGHTYLLEVDIYTTNPNVSATANIYWIETNPNVPDIKFGGGLRIKTITNYDMNDRFAGKEIYTYGNDNTGTILTPQYYQDINYETVVHRIGGKFPSGPVAGTFCTYIAESDINLLGSNYVPPGYSTIYHANSILPASQYSGSPVLYGKVTKTQVNSLGSPSGKSVYNYGVYEDGSTSPFEPITGILSQYIPKSGISLISNTWKNGNLLSEENYKSVGSGYQLITQKTIHYTTSLFSYENFLKVKSNYVHSGCEFQGSDRISSDFTLSPAPVTTGAIVPDILTESLTDDNGNIILTTKNMSYGTTPLLPSKIESLSSKGVLLTENIKYPKDVVVAGNVYEKMVNRNILTPVVQNQQLNSNIQTKFFKINYFDWFGNSKLLEPQSAEEQTGAATIETRVNFNKYDAAGNILEQQKPGDVSQVYLWGYNGAYLVAKILNTTYDIAKTYINEATLNAPVDDASLRANLNNLRSIPGAMVSTFTYSPLVGITSETDPAGKTTYYEYDSFNRLKNIKDYQGNIVKNFQYNYAVGCGPNCVVLPMQTLNGSNTISYPVGVFDVNGQLLGQATTQAQYLTLWNGNVANQAKGVLSAGTDILHFNLTLASGQTAPPGVVGLRFFEADLSNNILDAVTWNTAEYVDFGDGTKIKAGINVNAESLPSNTVVNYFNGAPTSPYIIHTYANSSFKTISFYHNDAGVPFGFDNYNNPATSLGLLKNLRGNIPQFTTKFGGSSYQDATFQSVTAITNWSSINSIIRFARGMGDGINPCRNLNFAQDFMQNNKNLQEIATSAAGYYSAGYRDVNFKIDKLKSDWNTFFTELRLLQISEDHWSHEDLSALKKLSNILVVATTQNHTNETASNPVVPLTGYVVDNIIIQIADGAGQTVSNGYLRIMSGGTARSAASDAAYNLLIAKGWTVLIG